MPCVFSFLFNVVFGFVALNVAFLRLWRLWYLHFSADDALSTLRSWRHRQRTRSHDFSQMVRKKLGRSSSLSSSIHRKLRPRSRSVPSSPLAGPGHGLGPAGHDSGHEPVVGVKRPSGSPPGSLSTSRRNSAFSQKNKEQADHDSLVAILDRGITGIGMGLLQPGISDHSDSSSHVTKNPHLPQAAPGSGGSGPASAPSNSAAKSQSNGRSQSLPGVLTQTSRGSLAYGSSILDAGSNFDSDR